MDSQTTLPRWTGKVLKYALNQYDGRNGKPYYRLNFSVGIEYTATYYDRNEHREVTKEMTKSYPGKLMFQMAEAIYNRIEGCGGVGCLMTLSAVFLPAMIEKDENGQPTENGRMFVSLDQITVHDVQPATMEPEEAEDDDFFDIPL